MSWAQQRFVANEKLCLLRIYEIHFFDSPHLNTERLFKLMFAECLIADKDNMQKAVQLYRNVPKSKNAKQAILDKLKAIKNR